MPPSNTPPPDRRYFREALRALRAMHAAGIVHTGLAHLPNWLVTVDGRPAFTGFQFAWMPRHRGRLFRALAYEDLRDLLAHKRACCPGALTARERRLLSQGSCCATPWLRKAWPPDLWAARLASGRRQGSIVSKSSVGASPGRK